MTAPTTDAAAVIERIRIARRTSTPLIAIGSPDPMAFIGAAVAQVAGWATVPPMVLWDPVRGFSALNPAGREAMAAGRNGQPFVPDGDAFSTPGVNIIEALTMMTNAPARTMILMTQAPRLLSVTGADGAAIVQGVANLRDLFKADTRTLIMLGHTVTLPAELRNDTLIIREPLPSETELTTMIGAIMTAARAKNPAVAEPDDATYKRAAEALAGLPMYSAEQAIALTIASNDGIDITDLWSAKRAIVEQQAGGGLKFEDARLTFDAVGGMAAARAFADGLFNGPRPPRCVVRIDEIEKAMAGIKGDNTGVSTDQLGVMLQQMEDRQWSGLIAAGPPGSGKSLYSKVIGGTYGIPTLQLDLGALKGSLVGESEQNIRAAMETLGAIGADDVLFIATSNDISIIPPELARRFRFGVWMFDLPTADERAAIWGLHLKTFALTDDATRAEVNDQDWTGAEIWTCCELSYRLRIPLSQAQAYVVPVAHRDAERIDRLRRTASGSWLSASTPGVYRYQGRGLAQGDGPIPAAFRRAIES